MATAKTFCFGDTITLRHVNTGKYLHSHKSKYPNGSRQQQVTCFGGVPSGWLVCGQHGNILQVPGVPLTTGTVFRLQHVKTKRNLHSHNIKSAVSKQQEVSCFGEWGLGDTNCNWRLGFSGGLIKLIHVNTGKSLHSHELNYPLWGDRQQEVTCSAANDSNDLWEFAVHAAAGKIPVLTSLFSPPLPPATPQTSKPPQTPQIAAHSATSQTSKPPQTPHMVFGDVIRLRHVNTGHALHSHKANYPSGSRQQQVTCFGGKDDNDLWLVCGQHGALFTPGVPLTTSTVFRLQHVITKRNLHSHGIKSAVSQQQEVSCFGDNGHGDTNCNWRLEFSGGFIKLIHVNTGKSLHSHKLKYPNWAAGQQEVTCFGGNDSNDYWKCERV